MSVVKHERFRWPRKTVREAILEADAVIAEHRKRAAARWPRLLGESLGLDWEEGGRLADARLAWMDADDAVLGHAHANPPIIAYPTALELVRAETEYRDGVVTAQLEGRAPFGAWSPIGPVVTSDRYRSRAHRRPPRWLGFVLQRVGVTVLVIGLWIGFLYAAWNAVLAWPLTAAGG